MHKNLFNIVNHAYKTVPFYKELIIKNGNKIDIDNIKSKADFETLPLITKDMIQSAKDKLLSEKYMHNQYNTYLTIRRTSGSTGKYLKIYWDKGDNIRSLIELWYIRKKIYNILPEDKFCYFYTTEYIQNKLVDEKDIIIAPNNRSIGFSKNALSEEKIKEIYLKIYEFNPIWLLLQPSMAVLLADCMQANNLPGLRNIKYMELSGEYLFDSVRDKLTNTFKCNINNQYGCNEANSIACECAENHMHCQSSNVYIEIIKDGNVVNDGEEGDIYITSLTNNAMPFIRYKIGDRGILYENFSCPCGNNEPVLKLLTGRVNDFVIDSNNEKLSAYIFLRPIEHINEKVGNIINQFQVIQNGINDFTVKLALKPSYSGWKDTIAKQFINDLKQPSLSDARWGFEFSDYLFPENETGKLAYFYNKL